MIACSTCGGRERPASEGFFSVSLWTRMMESGGSSPVTQRYMGGAHGVYIRPRPLVPLTGILLLRRVAMFQDDRHAFFISDREPGRAEIQ